jgi:hypothetical protein
LKRGLSAVGNNSTTDRAVSSTMEVGTTHQHLRH